MTVGLTIVRWPCVGLGTPARVAPATLAALVSIVVGSVVGGCVQREATSTVLVALGAERVRTDSPDAYVIRGQTVGVVCFDVSPPVTVAAEKAGALVDAFRASLASGSLPIETASTRVVLPVPVDGVEGEACDLVLFDDADGDGKWSSGESYVTGWSGGRGSYRLVARDGGRDQSADEPGWALVEGGASPTRHAVPSDVVVVLEPLLEPVVGR